jgi:hypothetical protein
MTQISLPIRPVPQFDRQFRWQLTVNTAFASGSLTAALLNLGSLIAISLARSVLSRFAAARRRPGHVNSCKHDRDPEVRPLNNGAPIRERMSVQADEGC